MILANGETNDRTRQHQLRNRAEQLAGDWSRQEQVLAVWLSGSVARGPVNLASDLDLHIVIRTSLGYDTPPWRFGAEGVIENVHLVRNDEIEEGLRRRSDPAALAEWMQRTGLGDELQGGACLFCRPSWHEMNNCLSDLLERRLDPLVINAVACRHACVARDWAVRAKSDLRVGATLDSHQMLRSAAQSLLIAALVRRGWIIRGSKKRPEIARAYAECPAVARALAVLEDVVGLRGLTAEKAQEICAARLALRRLVMNELRRLFELHANDQDLQRRVASEISFQERHNASAVDYYEPLIKQKFYQGPVNHIRALSGFARVPARLAHCAHDDSGSPIARWISTAGPDMELLEAWLSVANLTRSARTVDDWARQICSEAQEYCAEFERYGSPTSSGSDYLPLRDSYR